MKEVYKLDFSTNSFGEHFKIQGRYIAAKSLHGLGKLLVKVRLDFWSEYLPR